MFKTWKGTKQLYCVSRHLWEAWKSQTDLERCYLYTALKLKPSVAVVHELFQLSQDFTLLNAVNNIFSNHFGILRLVCN